MNGVELRSLTTGQNGLLAKKVDTGMDFIPRFGAELSPMLWGRMI